MRSEMRLQYISQASSPEKHLENIYHVCEAGVRWVQLRLKNVGFETYLETAVQCRSLCDEYGAVFIVNDRVDVAKESRADGVHLGLDDVSPTEARAELSDSAIIGGTANTLADCLQQVDAGVSYVGLGPLRFTQTKQNLSPVLGISGYERLVEKMRSQGIDIPVIAVGGVAESDIAELRAVGVGGVAVSGLLTRSGTGEDNVVGDLSTQVSRIQSALGDHGVPQIQ